MEINVEKLTNEKIMRRAIEMTSLTPINSTFSLQALYKTEHSPIYTQVFWVEMMDIYSFVSTHFVRHHAGVVHFVTSRRDDRGGNKEDGRYSLVNHGMFLNAKSLIDMSRKRLCNKAHTETIKVMEAIKKEISRVDYELSVRMVPECWYRGGVCHEIHPCGKFEEYEEA